MSLFRQIANPDAILSANGPVDRNDVAVRGISMKSRPSMPASERLLRDNDMRCTGPSNANHRSLERRFQFLALSSWRHDDTAGIIVQKRTAHAVIFTGGAKSPA
ncbi:hypothetical protein [Sphingomonas alpina]|uniref:Uncharacterized protein n=1 Tax=Sphingomonas alpina TaxID=653931 RepID=A0A7H0LJ69_9SPHN|nr:hypothetical protein [Sphingomonas alpina]QNQ09722.1 hypothetical protein H3Z74_00180 [Sphingomonas alpina]